MKNKAGKTVQLRKKNQVDFIISGGSRGGARGGRAPPLFWVKKEEMTEGKMADRASKSRPPPPPPPPPLAQGLDPPLIMNTSTRLHKQLEL